MNVRICCIVGELFPDAAAMRKNIPASCWRGLRHLQQVRCGLRRTVYDAVRFALDRSKPALGKAFVTPHVGLGQTVAKIILFGEHSVVYGYPAIALPMHSLRMTARVEPVGPDAPSTLTGLGWSGPMHKAPSHFASILRARDVAVEFIGAPDAQMSITTQSEFPAQRGLGSSAAAAGVSPGRALSPRSPKRR